LTARSTGGTVGRTHLARTPMKKLKLTRTTVKELSDSALTALAGASSGTSRQNCMSHSCITCHLNTCLCPTENGPTCVIE
jgi:hypothetical protein